MLQGRDGCFRRDQPTMARRQRLRLLRRTDAVQPAQRPALDLADLPRRRRPRRRHRPLRPGRRDRLRRALPARAARRRPRRPRAGRLRLQPLERLRRRRPRPRPHLQRARPTRPSTRAADAGCAEPIDGPPARRTCSAPSARRRRARTRCCPRGRWPAAAPPQPIDARLLDNALWLLRTYRLRVTAAREGGHNTHGDGTALDLVPAEPVDQAAWDASAGALARDLGWTPACGASGVRPACPLVPAIQFVGYDGYPGHGSPRTCSRHCPPTCTSPGCRRATAPARRRRRASSSRPSGAQRRATSNARERGAKNLDGALLGR